MDSVGKSRDSLHSVAREIFDTLWESDTSFITTEFVLVELGNALSSSEYRLRTALDKVFVREHHAPNGLRIENAAGLWPEAVDGEVEQSFIRRTA